MVEVKELSLTEILTALQDFMTSDGAISNETSHCVLLEHAAGRVNAPTFESLKRPPPHCARL